VYQPLHLLFTVQHLNGTKLRVVTPTGFTFNEDTSDTSLSIYFNDDTSLYISSSMKIHLYLSLPIDWRCFFTTDHNQGVTSDPGRDPPTPPRSPSPRGTLTSDYMFGDNGPPSAQACKKRIKKFWK